MATQEEMNTRILAAARSGDVDTLRDCINKGAEVNCKDVDYLVSNIVYRTHLNIIKIKIVCMQKVKNIKYVFICKYVSV